MLLMLQEIIIHCSYFHKWEKISTRNTSSHFFPGSRIPTEGKIVQEIESWGMAEMFHITPPDVRRLVTEEEVDEAS